MAHVMPMLMPRLLGDGRCDMDEARNQAKTGRCTGVIIILTPPGTCSVRARAEVRECVV